MTNKANLNFREIVVQNTYQIFPFPYSTSSENHIIISIVQLIRTLQLQTMYILLKHLIDIPVSNQF